MNGWLQLVGLDLDKNYKRCRCNSSTFVKRREVKKEKNPFTRRVFSVINRERNRLRLIKRNEVGEKKVTGNIPSIARTSKKKRIIKVNKGFIDKDVQSLLKQIKRGCPFHGFRKVNYYDSLLERSFWIVSFTLNQFPPVELKTFIHDSFSFALTLFV